MYASLFGISGALHLAVFEQPEKQVFFRNLLVLWAACEKGEIFLWMLSGEMTHGSGSFRPAWLLLA
jgi:hypothetical protein